MFVTAMVELIVLQHLTMFNSTQWLQYLRKAAIVTIGKRVAAYNQTASVHPVSLVYHLYTVSSVMIIRLLIRPTVDDVQSWMLTMTVCGLAISRRDCSL